ncbi:MAG: sulfotransferase family 2 domain-containing protein [Desulfobacteraceae bacterium]|jgi:hypothetical protein
MRLKRSILAHVHIEKAAGQTFISILERNFKLRHARVKPLRKEHAGIFSSSDLKTVIRINPFLLAMSGHSIKPSNDLGDIAPNIRYITILRDPIDRFLSHYQYWVERLNKKLDIEEFISIRAMRNFQTQKIAGSEDLERAKRLLRERFFLVGIVEEFEMFLQVLAKKLEPLHFDVSYSIKNVGSQNTKCSIYEQAKQNIEQIRECNALDTELYSFVKTDLFLKEKELAGVREGKNGNQCIYMKQQIPLWKIYRNFYYEPFIRLLRMCRGLPPLGSY